MKSYVPKNQSNSILTFIHGMVYASLILVSMFAYGMYTAQLRAHTEAQQVALWSQEDYLTKVANANHR